MTFDYLPRELLQRVAILVTLPGSLSWISGRATATADRRSSVAKHAKPAIPATFIDQGYCFNAGEWTFPGFVRCEAHTRTIAFTRVSWDGRHLSRR